MSLQIVKAFLNLNHDSKYFYHLNPDNIMVFIQITKDSARRNVILISFLVLIKWISNEITAALMQIINVAMKLYALAMLSIGIAEEDWQNKSC